jgi:glycosyltransferase involved in cell wall biosynthesis
MLARRNTTNKTRMCRIDLVIEATCSLGRSRGADTLTPMRVLVVTNFAPDASAPQRGRWVEDQVEEIRRLGVSVELLVFPRGKRHYLPAVLELRRLLRQEKFALVHAHYGLVGWCARLAGANPLIVSFHGTDVRHRIVGPLSRQLARRVDLVAAVSRALFATESGRPGLPFVDGAAVLPCGADLERFRPQSREEARRQLALEQNGRYLLFPASPSRPEKRHDRAAALADACGAELLTGGSIDPNEMPAWVNAADAVVITSDYEGFGLACVEAIACGVPVLSTPVGIAPYVLSGLEGAHCAPFDLAAWTAAARALLDPPGERIEAEARGRASSLSAARMAERTVVAYRAVLDGE